MATLGRPRGFDRTVALDGALRAFWEQGFESTSIADLTRRLGIAPPSLYAAFGDKRALFLEVLDRYYGRFAEFLDQTLAVPGARRDAIAAMLLGIARFYSTPGLPRGCMVNTVAVPAGEPVLLARLAELRSSVQERLRREARAAADAGELPRDLEPDVLAAVIWTTVLGMSLRSRDGADRAELESTARSIMAIWPPVPMS
ncbi:TetR/AcrR family transcriptional regulator [Amycolatopsis mediterranei]|uniref:TetR/AcrR family transcriptional regulator n=1 Tax=Amycolatopsis mediterranei TaxID=33910 RepID=UPI00341E3E19